MDQHLGASITLSFALVVLFAIILYQPEHGSIPPAAPEPPAVRTLEPGPTPLVSPPPLTPVEPLTAPAVPTAIEPPESPAPEPAKSKARVTANRIAPIAVRPRAADTTVSGGAVRARHSPMEVKRHEPFTLANEGETLRDMAIRVYGSADQVEELWRLNRDLLGQRDAPLPAGTLLRTP